MKSRRSTTIDNENGMASVETLPLLIIFVVLMSYVLGAFGVVHTGILNSIAARTYAFEAFRNRANLSYHRDTPGISPGDIVQFRTRGNRTHGINAENATIGRTIYATERPIRIGMTLEPLTRQSASVADEGIFETVKQGVRNETVEVNPVWIRAMYGICLNNGCGD